MFIEEQRKTEPRFSTLFHLVFKIKFSLKLVRGLDYYTGFVFEAVLNDYEYSSERKDDRLVVGSVAGGGRYDELIGKLDPNGRHVPCVGLSIGVERIMAIKEDREKVRFGSREEKLDDFSVQIEKSSRKTIETEVFVASAEKDFLDERMKLVAELWRHGIKVKKKSVAQKKICRIFSSFSERNFDENSSKAVGSTSVLREKSDRRVCYRRIERNRIGHGENSTRQNSRRSSLKIRAEKRFFHLNFSVRSSSSRFDRRAEKNSRSIQRKSLNFSSFSVFYR